MSDPGFCGGKYFRTVVLAQAASFLKKQIFLELAILRRDHILVKVITFSETKSKTKVMLH